MKRIADLQTLRKGKNIQWSIGDIAIIWAGKVLEGLAFPLHQQKGGFWLARKGWLVNKIWKNFFSLDFEKQFFISFLKLFFVWNPIWTLLVSMVMGNRTWASIFFRWEWSFFEASVVALLGMGALKAFFGLEQLWNSGPTPPKHSMGWYIMFLGFCAPPGLYLALRLMVAYINYSYAGDPIEMTFHWQYYGLEIFWVWMLLLVSFVFKSWQDMRDAVQKSQLRAEELEKERLQALLTKLKDQMNPHFLFNTLNTVASLIPADPVKAEQVVVKLSSLFQGVLSATRRANHPLDKELEFCRHYLDIEQARFGPRLTAEFQLLNGLDPTRVQVPVLLLQPLVENAVKHGLSSRASGGRIWIRARAKGSLLELEVEDDGVGFGHSPYSGTGTALENCRKRLELGFGKDGKLEIQNRPEGGSRVILTMPWISLDSNSLEEK